MYYAIISDIHANFAALQAVDQQVQRLRLQLRPIPLRYWFLGDILGYGPHPLECLEWLRFHSKVGERWIPGNHDVEVVRLATSNRQGETNSSAQAQQSWKVHLDLLQRPDNTTWWEWIQTEIERATSEEARSMVVEEHGSLTAVFVHASVPSGARRTQYLYPWTYYRTLMQNDMTRLWEQYGGTGRTVCLLHGHTHYPVLAQLATSESGITFHPIRYGQPLTLGEGCYAINPGSVGQPRDGDPRAAFALLNVTEPSITFHRTMYDVNATVRALEMGGYLSSLVELVTTADGGADLAYYRSVYLAPRLQVLEVLHDESEHDLELRSSNSGEKK